MAEPSTALPRSSSLFLLLFLFLKREKEKEKEKDLVYLLTCDFWMGSWPEGRP